MPLIQVNKTQVIDGLRELADFDFQKRVWLSGAGPEMSSFVEAVCGLFDDSGLGLALDKGQSVYDPEIDSLLRWIQAMISKIERVNNLSDLSSPQMDMMRNLAAKALSALTLL